MKCHGKCHMMKMMKAEEKKESKGLPGVKNSKPVLLFAFNLNKQVSQNPVRSSIFNTKYTATLSSLHKPAVFRPPLG
jgi:hypothetical protein